MKLLQLLSHYLRTPRCRRARTLASTINDAVVVDAALEPRVLLSAASQPASDSVVETEPSESELSPGSLGSDAVIAIASSAGSVQVNQSNNFYFNSIATSNNSASDDLIAAEESFFSDTQDGLNYDGRGVSDILQSQDNRNVVEDSLTTITDELHDATDSVSSSIGPKLTTEQAPAPPVDSSTVVNDLTNSVQTPSRDSGEAVTEIETTEVTGQSQSAGQRPTARKLVHIRPIINTTASESSTVPGTTPFVPVRKQRTGNNRRPITQSTSTSDQTLTLQDDAKGFDNSDVQHVQARQTSTAVATTEFRRLLNSFVQFDVVDRATTRLATITDWLSEQLTSVDVTQADARSAELTTNNVYAEQPVLHDDGDVDNQQIKHAWSRIDFGGPIESVLIMLSENPPEPPDAFGIWQQIKFDCNPRGPPHSDGLPASEFTRLTGSAIQLQQLRHSIAPRGPSAASVN